MCAPQNSQPPVQISGGGSSINDPYAKGFAGGAGVNFAMPLTGGYGLNLGASGSTDRVNVRAPGYSRNIRDNRLTGANVGLTLPDQGRVGLEYSNLPIGPVTPAGQNLLNSDQGRDRRVMLRYSRPF